MQYDLWVAPPWRWLAIAALLAVFHRAIAQTTPQYAVEPALASVRLGPQVRSEPLAPRHSPGLQGHSIAHFLGAPQVFDQAQWSTLPRIVGASGSRSLYSKNDVVFARSLSGHALVLATGEPREWRIYRQPSPLIDPASGELLGMQAEYLGRARLLRGEHGGPSQDGEKTLLTLVPASFEIVHAVAEIRTGDRLLQSPEIAWNDLTPHAPKSALATTVISLYEGSFASTSKNQIVIVNQGHQHGLEPGHVLSIRTAQRPMVDLTDPARAWLHPPVGFSGKAMVVLTFDKLAYALISDSSEPVQVGDWLTNP